MKKVGIMVFCTILSLGCKEKPQEAASETESEPVAETNVEMTSETEWTVLFDGTSFDGWKEYLKDGVSEHWKLEDGAMVFYPPENREQGESYNLVTDKDYTNFILSLDWKISEGGNSGVFWGVKEDEKYNQPYETGPEIQVLDNERHPDAKAGLTHQAGALYDMEAPSADVARPAGEWNTMVITVDHERKRGEVVLNGEKIVAFPVGNELWNVMVSKSKFADWEGFGKFITGKIGLQDHGDRVAYRNIKIKEL
ncbi:DUF1080 domain-containing protein [Flavobacteriaceae bacterium TP-CH-4]|uniref:DUF1080 domain-containing protein n=1 Tax=Pelagihabitans pacificus TaxID=2696054 RepID=A0A967AWH7_9FLAO|nr:DUF1080 domain-containing protein [Pelagihabitans pacificus]NHF60430.1 DUF1080 domain-containing protein [Pelagihabitans pacificus]